MEDLEFPEQDLDAICRKYNISLDGVDEMGRVVSWHDVDLSSYSMARLPVDFSSIPGSFFCPVGLSTLKGCPEEVEYDFYFSGEGSSAKTLEGGPDIVGQECRICDSQITDLRFGPMQARFLYLERLPNFHTLDFMPEGLDLLFVSDCPKITSLRGIPQELDTFGTNIEMKPSEMRYLLLTTVNSLHLRHDIVQVATGEDAITRIFSEGRVNGTMPSELIPGKIKELKELDELWQR